MLSLLTDHLTRPFTSLYASTMRDRISWRWQRTVLDSGYTCICHLVAWLVCHISIFTLLQHSRCFFVMKSFPSFDRSKMFIPDTVLCQQISWRKQLRLQDGFDQRREAQLVPTIAHGSCSRLTFWVFRWDCPIQASYCSEMCRGKIGVDSEFSLIICSCWWECIRKAGRRSMLSSEKDGGHRIRQGWSLVKWINTYWSWAHQWPTPDKLEKSSSILIS